MSFLFRMPMQYLALISVGGGLVTLTFGIYSKRSVKATFESQPYFRESLMKLKNHPGAIHVLGKNITSKGLKISNQIDQAAKEHESKLIVPVFGSEGKANYIIKAVCDQVDTNGKRTCLVHRCQLEIKETKNLDASLFEDKYLVIYDREKHGAFAYESKRGDAMTIE